VRILAFSDVWIWKGYERLVDQWKPHVVALAGDLTSDGGAHFWTAALKAVPEYKMQIQALERERLRCLLRENIMHREGPAREGDPNPISRYPSSVTGSVQPTSKPVGTARLLRPGPETRNVEAQIRDLNRFARQHSAFHAARKKMHVDKFYRFLA